MSTQVKISLSLDPMRLKDLQLESVPKVHSCIESLQSKVDLYMKSCPGEQAGLELLEVVQIRVEEADHHMRRFYSPALSTSLT